MRGRWTDWVDLEMKDFEHRDAENLPAPCAGYKGAPCCSDTHKAIASGRQPMSEDHTIDGYEAGHRYRVRCAECGVVPVNGHLPHVPKKTPHEVTVAVVTDVALERERQNVKWGEQNHDDGKWFQILMEEVGEAAKAGLDDGDDRMREELVQVAAVAVAFIEAIDRRTA